MVGSVPPGQTLGTYMVATDELEQRSGWIITRMLMVYPSFGSG